MPKTLSKVYLHVIFSTKNRERSIRHKEEMFKYIAGVLNGQDCQPIIVGGDADHVHALFCMSRTKTISDVVREVKSSATVWYKEKTDHGFAWQQGYGVFSVGQTNVETVRHYIERQEEHHSHTKFQDEFRWFLDNYHVTYDERYVWD